MPRYIDAEKFIERIKASPAFSHMGLDGEFLQNVVIDLLNNAPTADVVLREQETLHHLKRDLHEKAIYPHGKGIDSYILLKVVDAIINNYLRELEEKR